MTARYSIFNLARHALGGHRGWPAAWRTPDPQSAYDVVIIGGGAVPSLGHVTASVESPNLGRPIALALVRDGGTRLGEDLIALSPLTDQRVVVTVADPVFYDPEGARLRA
jgi:glycine cleavage system aminomethyltransferase T